MTAPARSGHCVSLGQEEGAGLGSNTKTLDFLRLLVDFLNKYSFICCMSSGPLPKILNRFLKETNLTSI